MRLSSVQQNIIKSATTKLFGENANIYLFGSRVDDTKKGGDIDLLIETATNPDLLKKASLKNLLEIQLNLPVDLLTIQRNVPLTPFQKIAFEKSILL